MHSNNFEQRSEIDYQEAFATSPKLNACKIIPVRGHQIGWNQPDDYLYIAVLNSYLNIDLYTQLTKGSEQKDKVILLQKFLCGLKKAATFKV